MTGYQPSLQTVILIAVFTLLYMLSLIRQAVRGKLDFYDLVMLSTVALLPGLFVFLPKLAEMVGAAAGVAFPFVVMFGALLFVVFTFLHRLTIVTHEFQKRNRLLVQEVGLLREELEQMKAR